MGRMNKLIQRFFNDFQQETWFKFKVLSVFLLISISSVTAQTYKTHYIAPAPWQYWSSANEIVVSTNTAGTSATVKKSDGTLITTLTPTPGNPAVYRFIGNPVGLLKNSLNTVLNGAGIIVTGNNPIAVNVRNVASDDVPTGAASTTNDQYIKGNASLFSFGDAAVGNAFRVGYYRDGDLNGVDISVSTKRPVYSVLAIENNTTVKLNGTAITTLNAGQSYILQATLGSLVETSGPSVMNTGINVDAPEACGDGAYNPVPPVSSLGNEYVVVRGKGNKTAEQTTVVATEANTDITVMNFDHNGVLQSTNNYNLIAAGSFVTFSNGISTGTGTGNVQVGDPFSGSRIVSTKNIVAYSGTANNCEVDIATLAPLSSCGGSLKAETAKFRANNLTDLPYFAYVVTKSPTDKVYLTTNGGTTAFNNTDIETIPGVGLRRQLGSTGAYAIDFDNDNIGKPNSFYISSNSRLTVAMVQSGGGFSMSNFLSPFPEKALKPTYIQSDCASALLSADPNSVAPFQWYLNGVAISGATSSTYRASISGTYTITSTLDCGISSQSLPVTIALCNIDLILNKTVNNASPAKGGTVNFTVTVKNSDIASGTVTGTGNAIGVSATDVLPSGYTYVSSVAASGTSYNPITGLWSIGSLSAGQTVTLTISAKVNNSGPYTNTATVTGPQNDPVLANNTASASVNPVDITLISTAGTDSQSICVGGTTTDIQYQITGTPTVTVTGLGLSGLTYGTAVSGGNTILTINSGTVSLAGNYNYSVNSVYASPSTTVINAAGSITVNPAATTPVFAAGSTSSRCQGSSVQSYTATASNTTGITYALSPSNAGVIDASTGSVTWSAVYNGTATITATAASSCGNKSSTHTVTINSTGTITGGSTVCSGSNGTLTLTGAPATVVRWESSTNNGINWTSISNTTTALNYSNIAVTTVYRAIVSGGGCTNAASASAIVTVTPRPVIADQTYYICKTGSFTFAPVEVSSGTTYTWAAPVLSSTDITGGTSGSAQLSVNQTLTNSGTSLQTATYTVTPTYASCSGNPFKITVYVVPTLSVSATGQTICSAAAFSVTPVSNVNGTNYTWTAALTNGTATGFSNQSTAVAGPISQTLSNTSGADATVRYTVTPVYNGCTGATFTFDIIVRTATPAPTASNQTFCEIMNATVANLAATGTAVKWYTQSTGGTALTSTTALANGTYYASQTVNGCESASRASVTVSITATPAPTASNQTFCEISNATVASLSSTGTAVKWYTQSTGGTALTSTTALANGTYYASQTVNGCESASRASVTVTIYQSPKGFNDIKTLDCTGTLSYNIQTENINNMANGGNSVPSSFTWTISSNANVTGAASGSGNTINQTLVNTSNSVQTIIYTVTPKATVTGACVGNPFTITVNVPVCSSISITKTANLTAVNQAGNVINYTITVANTGNANQNNVVLNDPLLGGNLNNPVKTGNTDNILEKGEVWTYAGSYTVLQSDLNNNGKPTNNSGKISNTASVTTTELPTAKTAVADVNIVLNPAVTLVKTGTLNINGNTISYLFTVKNTGNVTLSNLAVTDSKVTGAITLGTTTLAPGASTTATAAYTISAVEKAAGTVSNTATVNGKTPSNANVSDVSGTTESNDNPTVTNTGVYAVDDAGTLSAVTGGVAVNNVLANDKVNGNQATLVNVTIIQISSANPNISIDPATGKVNVLPGTPVGDYTLVYQIEDKANPGNVKQATVTVHLTTGAILAKDDSGSANSVTGGTAVANVLANDTFNGGTQATLANVTITNGTNDSNGKVTLDPATGKVSVAANTPAAVYTLTYTITDKLDASKTSTATVKITVSSNAILAKDDAGSANAVTGGTNIIDVLANDTCNGGTQASLANVTITNGTNDSNGKVTLDPLTGKVSVAANTPAAVYTLTYTITDKLDPSKTSTATIKVTIASGAILAKDDTGSANAVIGGTNIIDVLANDTYNGGTQASLANVTITNGTNDSNGKVTLDPLTGKVSVAANTPAAVYTLTYTITDKLDPGKTSTATIKVTIASGAILAKDDAGSANAVTGGANIIDVLTNDTYNGGTQATLANVTITNGINDSNGKVTLDPATGKVSVAANTPAAVYTLTYTITDKLDPSKTSTATVKVTVSSGAILAKDDAGSANSVTGGTNIIDVLTNDTYNGGTQASLANVTITNGTNDSNGKVTLDPATGKVSVSANTPAAVYTLTYTITDKLDPSKTSTATVKVTVASGAILAKDDTGSANSVTGGTAVTNVLANDSYNGTTTAPTLANVTITNGTNDSNGKVTLDPATGAVTVATNTPAGIYTLTYTITDKLDASKTSTATIKVTVASGVILAKDDTGSANSVTGGTAVADVLANDTFNGGTQATLANVNITNGTNDSNGKVTLDPVTGAVSVATNTPAGVYTLTYTITDKLDASKTSTATVKVTVASGAILAKDDIGSANSVTGGTAVANVLANDTYNGGTQATLANVTIANGTNDSNGKVTLDPLTGKVSVAANTPAGVYTLTYTITDKLDPSKTSTATVKVTIASGAILAKDDAGSANAVTGGANIIDVLANDTYNGGTQATLANVTITNGTNDSNGKVILDPATGAVTVAVNTPAGVYTLTYTITDKLDPSKTSTATVKVTVASGAILAKDDAGSANSVTGGTNIIDVLANDSYNGGTQATLANVTTTNGTNDSNGKVTLDPLTGKVSVAANTPAAVYTLTYTITDKLDPSKTSTATVKLTVSSDAILAKDDAGSANAVAGGTNIIDVLANDTYNGGTQASLANVTITNGTNDSNGKVTLDPATGKVSVAANTPAGVYTLTYTIIDKLDASKTSTATVKVTVSSGAILAKDDIGSANSVTGGTAVANVLANDTYNGGTQASLANLTITNGTNDSNGKVTLDPATGKVSVATNTPAGVYTLTYTITDKLDASKTSTATVKVTMASGAILAKDDAGSANAVTGGTNIIDVLANDTYNGGTQASLANVTISNGTNDSNGKVTLDPATGKVSVAANTPASIYTLTYTITDKLDASKTSTATVKVTVASGAILAKDDAGSANSVTGGTNIIDVLANDTYNGGTQASLANVTITNGTNDSNGKVTLDPLTGKVSVAANTPAAVYNLTYTITDKLDASKTSVATVKVTVSSDAILAKDDAGSANAVTGGTNIIDVLTNDTYNGGTQASLANVTITNGANDSNGKVTLDPATGKVSVAANTPAAVYTLTYTITDKLDPSKTSTATVKVTVASGAILAKDDTGSANSVSGGTDIIDVLANDTYNGGTQASLANVTISNGTNDSNGKVTLDPLTGKVSVAANTPAAVYTLTYTITDKLDPSKTSTATVKVTVASGALLAKDDSGNVNGLAGGLAIANVLANDSYNGTTIAPTLNDVNLSQVSTSNPNVKLNIATGQVDVAPNTPAGVYTLIYEISDKLDAGQTKTATVTVTVGAPAMIATADSGNANGYTGGTAVENVLLNDTYNGNPATLNEVKLSQVSTTNPNVTLDVTTGKVNVAPNTPAGIYTLVYQIEDKLNPGQTKNATVTVTVSAPVMVATADSGNANGYTGGTAVENVLLNDIYNGNPANLNEVKLSQVSTTNPNVTLDVTTGKVNVAPNTPAGTYEVVYQIEDKLNPGQMKNATVTVTVGAPAMIATNDSGNANGYTGGTAVENVLLNDTYNGNPATLNEVKLSQVSTTNPNVTLDVATGKVNVAPNTPAGTYEVVYQIEDKLNSGQTKTATVTVTVSAPAMVATSDSGNANGYSGGTAVENVLLNDTYNGNPATLNEVKLGQASTTNPNVTLDVTTGKVNVAPNTPAGIYTLVYQIEDKLNHGQTKTATVTVTVGAPAMVATADSGNANGYTGGTAVENVLLNDTYNGNPATLNEVKLSQVSTTNPNVTLDVTTGKVNVAPNTPAGIYTLVYQIEDKLNPGQTKNATVTVTVSAPVMVATADSGNANGYTGGTAVENVLTNDTYNGNPATLNEVKLSQVSTTNLNVTLDVTTGKVNVAPNTPAGIYTLVYQIEDKLNPGQTKNATVTVTVSAPAMVATNDSGNANGYTGGTAVENVLLNDTYNGNPATLNEVKLSQVSTTNPNVTLDVTSGKVNVAPNTPAGIYEVVYQIEDKLNPGQTKNATVTVTVSAPALVATNDSGNANGYTGGTAVENVLLNDTYNGNPATLKEVKLSQVSTTNPNVTLDVITGKVNVAPNTQAGTYTLVYQIEDKLNPGQTKNATVTVTVSAPAMVATNDSGNANGYTGGTAVENVLTNDTYNGNPATLNEVKLSQVSTTNPNVTLDVTTGKVNVAPNTPAGTYTLVYQIEDKLNPGQTKTATVTVTVGAPALVATADSGNANGYTGGTAVENVLLNDTYNGNPATLNEVKLSQISTTNPNVILDVITGKVNVAPNTQAGTYTLVYQIEDKLNPGQTKTATVTVTVGTPAMVATNDSGNANGYTGGTAVENVLLNDTYNGNPATLNEVKLSQVSTTNPNVTLDVNTGKVNVAPNTPAGTYEVVYQIEDKLNPGQTKTATVTVTVGAPALVATADSGNANGYTGGTAVENVLLNDTYNGNPATLNEVKLSQVSTTNPNVTLDVTTGKVNVAPNTPAGTYEVVYQIEDKLNPGQTKNATITVTVSAPAMVATNDSGNANGYTGGTAVENVLTNDTYNGNPATLNEVKLSQVSTTNPNVTLDVTTGKVNVAPNTPTGTYEVVYQIEDKLNPGQTKNATVTVTVGAPALVATADSGNANGYTGGTAVENVLLNDTYNGNPATLNEVKLSQVSTTNPNVTLDVTTGKVNVAPNTPAGTYEVVYQIEDKLNPGQTKTATVTVTVGAPAMIATADSGNANGYTGGTAVENVLLNDTYNGNPANLNEVKLSQVSTTNPNVTLDVTTGKVNVAPNTPAGTYEVVYQIEDKLNPGQTKTATVTVTVGAPAMIATADSGNANGYTGGTAVENVLLNDTYNGNPANLNEVKLSQVSTTNPNVTLDVTTGKVNVAPNTPAGTYEVVYQIEDKLNPGQTKNATVTVTVGTSTILAQDDAGTANGFTGGVAIENILLNDTYNNNSKANTTIIAISQISTSNANVTLDLATGKVNVAEGTLPGVYTLSYQITDKLDPGKSSTAVVTVTIPNWIADLQISKTANVTGVESNGTISYTINIKNNGPATVLSGQVIGLTENLPSGLENITYNTLGGTYSSTANTFTLAADLTVGKQVSLTVNGRIAAGFTGSGLTNSVALTPAQGTTDPESGNNQSTITTPLLKGKVALIKTGILSADGNNITYSFKVTNVGDVELNNIILTDAKLGLNKTFPNALAVGASFTYSQVYILTQGDKDAALVTNTASVSAKTPVGNAITDVSGTDYSNDNPTETPISGSPKFTFTKVASAVGTKVGESISYTFTLTNAGTVTLNNLSITDAAVDAGSISPANISILAPGASVTITAKHTLTQNDVNQGSFTNQASVKVTDNKGNIINQVSDDPSTPALNDPTVTKLTPTPGFTLTKSATNTANKAGDIINYSIVFKNTGNVTLTDIALVDANADAGSLTPSNITSVLPGATVSITAKHTVKQSDVNAGGFSNQVSATVKDPKGNTITKVSDDPSTPAADDATFTKIIPDPSVRFTKMVANSAGIVKTIEYSIQVTNTGNITLTDIVVTDPGADAGSITPSVISKLEPAETAMILARHTLVQSEIDYGKFVNQASLVAKFASVGKLNKLSDDPRTPVLDDPTIFLIKEAPGLTLVKTGVLSADGNSVTYTFIAKNTGNVTLTNFSLVDPKISSAITFAPSSIAPDETATATAVYTISQAEKNASSVRNTATLTAASPAGTSVTDVSGTEEDNDYPTILELPQIVSAKTVADANNNGRAEASEVLTYTITVKNNGNTARTGVKIADPIPANTTYVGASANNGGVLVGNALNWNNLTIPANGQVVVNFKVTVNATLPSGTLAINNSATVTDPANASTPLNPAVSIPTEGALEGSKSVADNKGNKDGKAQANEILTYSLTVKNTGGSALNGVTITDELPAGLTYVPGSVSGYGTVMGNSLKWTINMQANSSTVLTLDAKVAPDVNSYNTIKNIAVMTAPNGKTLNPEAIINVDQSADLMVTKELLTKGDIKTGSDVMYKITVTNKGPNRVTGVTVNDRLSTIIDAPKEITVTIGATTYSSTTSDLVWLVGSLDLNQSASLTFKSRTLASGVLNNSATVKADQPDPVSNNNLVLADAATISGDDLLIPNLFTPNGDGINDTFEINGLSEFAENELTIINRWGNEVFRTKAYKNNWTGEGLNEGTYYYLLRARKGGSNEWKVYKGYITLIRAFKN